MNEATVDNASHGNDVADLGSLFSEAIETLTDGFGVFTEDFRVLFANSQARKDFSAWYGVLDNGGTLKDAVLETIRARADLSLVDDIDAFADEFVGQLLSGEPMRLPVDDGRTVLITFWQMSSGNRVATSTDITEDLIRRRELREANTRVNFVNQVSHELKTPLASIKAYIEMLIDGEVTDEVSTREFYETISGQADRLQRMIERILTISRIESGAVTVLREPVSMTAVIKQVVGGISSKVLAKNITLQQQLAPVYYQIEADYDLICQAVGNILSNAVTYTPSDGKVTINASVDEGRGVGVIEVTDTGVGIAAEELPRIFQKFYRVHANIKLAPGTGLGLPLARYIIENIHGGKLSVTSELGMGSSFRLELPLVI